MDDPSLSALAFQSIPTPLIVLDADLCILLANQAFLDSRPDPAAKIIGQPFCQPDETCAPDCLLQEGLEQLLKNPDTGRTFTTICHIGGPDHPQKTVIGKRLQDPSAPLAKILLTIQPSEPSPRQEEDPTFNQFIFDKASIGIFRISPEACILDVNEHACRSLGYSKEELCSLSILDIDPDFNPDKWSAHLAHMRRWGHQRLETRHQRKNRSIFHIEVNTSRLEFAGQEFLISFVNDITQRVEAQQILLERENLLRELQQVANLGHYIFDTSTNRWESSEILDQILGIDQSFRHDVAGWLDLIHPEERDAMAAYLQEKVLGEKAPFDREYRIIHQRSGKVRWVHGLGRLELNELGQPIRMIGTIGDITERKLVEEELRLTQFSVDKAGVGIFWIEPGGRIVRVNDHACKSLGYSRDELTRLAIFDIDPNFSAEQWLDHRRHLAGRTNITIETLHQRKNGEIFPVEVSVNLLEYQGKSFSVSFARDISDRKEAEKKLRESEERLRLALQAAQQGLYDLDLVTGNTQVSPEYATMLGYPPDTFSETNAQWIARLHPDDRRRVTEKFHAYLNGKTDQYKVEYRQRTQEGHWKWVLSQGSIVARDAQGRPLRMVGTHTDITERKWAEEALRESEERFRSMLDSVPTVAVQGYRPDGTIFYWNRGNVPVYGYAQEEALGQNLLELIIPPEMREEIRSVIHQGIETGRMPEAAELNLMRKDGSRVPVLSNHAILAPPGREPELYCIDMDLTRFKQVEEEKVRLETQLFQAQKMESVGRLAGGVAHDFNNMLSVIFGCVDLLKAKLPEDSPHLKFVNEIEKAAGHSRDVTRQLLAFSRKQIISPRPLNLNHLVSNMEKTLARLIGEDIDLQFQPKSKLWETKLDPSQVEQILLNLAVNARDAMPTGGKLTIETDNVEIDQAYCNDHYGFEPGAYVLLAVSDSGCGMDKETLAHIFEPFFTTKEIGKGTGLGLATVYGIVRQSGGFVNVYSEPRRGTTFKILLPKLIRQDDTLGAEERPELVSGAGTVLLVEDDDMVREITATMLETIGYTVLVAESAVKAEGFCRDPQQPIDLLLTDVVMPEVSGTEMQERITRLRPGIKILYMSGYTPSVIGHHGVLTGEVHFIHKPFTLIDLSKKLSEVLGG